MADHISILQQIAKNTRQTVEKVCCINPANGDPDTIQMCDGTGVPVVVKITYIAGVPSQNSYYLDGTPFIGTPVLCPAAGAAPNNQLVQYCDQLTGRPVLAKNTFNATGAPILTYYELNGTLFTGTPVICGATNDPDTIQLCDQLTGDPIIAKVTYNSVTGIPSVAYFNLNGTGFGGTAVVCNGKTSETVILCDKATGNQVFVKVQYSNTLGTPIIQYFNPDGTTFTGTAISCELKDTEFIQMCDTVGVPVFVRMNYNATGVPLPTATYANGTVYAGVLNSCSSGNVNRLVTVCMCDNVAGDFSNIVKFIRLYHNSYNPTTNSFNSSLVGNYTDEHLTTPYTPITPLMCDTIGTNSKLKVGRVVLTGGMWVPGITTRSINYNVINASITPAPTFRGTDNVVSNLYTGEKGEINLYYETDSLDYTNIRFTAGATDIISIIYTYY